MKQILSKRNRNLLLEMIRMDFKLRYQASLLGYLWSVMKPLFMFAILYVVFAVILKLGNEPNYALSLLLGIVFFNFFAEGTGGALKSVVAKGNLIRKIDIPRYLIPVSAVSSAFVNMLLNLFVVFVFVAFASNTAVSWWTLIILPILILELVIFTLGVGILLSALYVRLRDIDHIWEVVRQALFYSMPIIYPLSRVPYENIQQIMLMNPLVQIIEDARSVVTYSGVVRIPHVFASELFMLIPIGIVLATMLFARSYFRKQSRYFAELV